MSSQAFNGNDSSTNPQDELGVIEENTEFIEHENSHQDVPLSSEQVTETVNIIIQQLFTLGYCGAAVPSRIIRDDPTSLYTEWIIPMSIIDLALETLAEYIDSITYEYNIDHINNHITDEYITDFITEILDIRDTYTSNLSPGEWDANNHPSLYAVFFPKITDSRDIIESQIIRMPVEYQNYFSPFMDRLNECINNISEIINRNE